MRFLAAALVLLTGCSFDVDEFRDGEQQTSPSETTATNVPPETTASCAGLPTPSRLLAANSHCYWIARGKVKGRDASEACGPGHPVTISAVEQPLVASLLEELSVDAWIGLRASEDERFEWITGERESFRAWRDHYPKDSADAPCVLAKRDGYWENRKCSDEHSVACER